jgi:predicted phosphodiesterase
VLRFPVKQDKWQKTKRPEKFLAFRWAYDHLSDESRLFLLGLPEERTLEVEGHPALLIHGSPASAVEPLTPKTPVPRLRSLVRQAASRYQVRFDLVACGHSHLPFARRVGGVWWVNPGSVGRPDDGDPRASYAMLRVSPEKIEIDHFRIEYDLDRAAAAIHSNGLPPIFADMLRRGLDLDTAADR